MIHYKALVAQNYFYLVSMVVNDLLWSLGWQNIRGVPNIVRQPAEAEYSAVLPNILPKPNRGSLFAE